MKDKTQHLIGKLLEGEGAERDAIHIAVAPMVASVQLAPGEHVGLTACGKACGRSDNHIGIVDPFLQGDVEPGDEFFVFLYPNTVTSLRHVWTHPAFDEASEANKATSESWLRQYASRVNFCDDDEEAFSSLIRGLRRGEIFYHGSDLHGLHELQDPEKLKMHAERYLGIPINWAEFTFSCSC